MKVILNNHISSVSATSENINYPDDNVLNDSPKKIWRANATNAATITCTTNGKIDTLAIYNTNASSLFVTIADPNEFTWANLDWQNIAWHDLDINVPVSIENQANNNAIWGTFNPITVPASVSIAMTAPPGEVLQAGVIVLGESLDLPNPHYGIGQGLIDYSISAELSNGAYYYRKRDIVRRFSCRTLMNREDYFYSFMNDFAQLYGSSPKAWRLTDTDSLEWVVYARFDGMPEGSHDLPVYTWVGLNLTEVL